MTEQRPITEILEAHADDHEQLHQLGCTIQQAILVNDVGKVADCLLELQAVQTSHFRFEERLMEEVGFPDRETHARSHEKLTATLGAINQALDLGRFSSLSRELGAFINDSLAHIEEIDETFRCFLVERTSAAAVMVGVDRSSVRRIVG
jgi:hemerythrin-like metal-binding protein